ncbi:MAG: YicC family protein [Candidatus Omnitrophica bacterium]|nr:YicC family protein [Candidatus Omnitrophota bacterium]
MIKSMTGFAAKELKLAGIGRISVELRSINHKFLETVLHLPEGFLSLEESIKKIIEVKIKRGRINCVVNIVGARPTEIFLNKQLLKNYISELTRAKEQLKIKDSVTLDTLIHLPGVLSLAESPVPGKTAWPHLKTLIASAVNDLVEARQKEGAALYGYLRKRGRSLQEDLKKAQARFKKIITERLGSINTDEERGAFLKDSDITEEIERLVFHISNFLKKIRKNGPVGKELDFIAQEMQREANTMAAKSCDGILSSKVVQIKSQIEKIREQLQNVE